MNPVECYQSWELQLPMLMWTRRCCCKKHGILVAVAKTLSINLVETTYALSPSQTSPKESTRSSWQVYRLMSGHEPGSFGYARESIQTGVPQVRGLGFILFTKRTAVVALSLQHQTVKLRQRRATALTAMRLAQ